MLLHKYLAALIYWLRYSESPYLSYFYCIIFFTTIINNNYFTDKNQIMLGLCKTVKPPASINFAKKYATAFSPLIFPDTSLITSPILFPSCARGGLDPKRARRDNAYQSRTRAGLTGRMNGVFLLLCCQCCSDLKIEVVCWLHATLIIVLYYIICFSNKLNNYHCVIKNNW